LSVSGFGGRAFSHYILVAGDTVGVHFRAGSGENPTVASVPGDGTGTPAGVAEESRSIPLAWAA